MWIALSCHSRQAGSSPPGVVVTVTLQIDQTAVISQNAFHATLNLANNSGAQVSDLQVLINPVDTNGAPATNAFFIQPPMLSGITAVDGTGSLAVGSSGQANWTIIPTTNAAPAGNTNMVSVAPYPTCSTENSSPFRWWPCRLRCCRTRSCILTTSCNTMSIARIPFTNVVEPPVPFALGLRVRNQGLGIANDFTITSFQPTIVNNANGLLINFQIIDSQAGDSLSPVPSLTLDFGDIDPGTNAVGIWWMTSSLEGDFINFSSTFRHSDALGGLETSLIQGVTIHEMNHVVRITYPSDDGIPDFLCNDTTNVDALPDNVYSSDGNVYPVTSLTGATASSGCDQCVNSSVTISDWRTSFPEGFVYFQLPDPSGRQPAITSVKRSDGSELLVGPNVWQTPVPPAHGAAAIDQSGPHLRLQLDRFLHLDLWDASHRCSANRHHVGRFLGHRLRRIIERLRHTKRHAGDRLFPMGRHNQLRESHFIEHADGQFDKRAGGICEHHWPAPW